MSASTALLSSAEALALVLEATPRGRTLRRGVHEAANWALAEPTHAAFDHPRFDTSIMDGYALRASDLDAAVAASLPIAGESAAGRPLEAPLPAGSVARIFTGAALPEGADVVVPQEDARAEEGRFSLQAKARPGLHAGRWVRPRGSDVREGELLLDAGHPLDPGDAAMLGTAGLDELAVVSRPEVAILSTGDELVEVGAEVGPNQRRSTNGFMLEAMVAAAGGLPHRVGIVGDDPEATRAALAKACEADIVVSSGGISVGVHDHVFDALTDLGFEVLFHKLRIRPGRPTTFGRVGETLIFALPGNPASTWMGAELFVRPAIRKFAGWPEHRWSRPERMLSLGAALRGERTREHFVRARVRDGAAWPITTQDSGALRSISAVDAVLCVPEATESLPAGAEVRALIVNPDV